jgi:predicted ATPase/DNA-binding SARP family transcriptional activator
MSALIRLQFLGPVQVECEGQVVEHLALGKALALLGYLAVREQPLAREHLADLFWPDLPANRGRANLSWLLHQLNDRLPGCLQASRHTVQFQQGALYCLDLAAFVELLAQGDMAALAEAVDLYRGDLLEGLQLDGCADFELWLVGERERWRQRAVGALRELVTHHDRCGQHGEALRFARRLLDLEPWLEETHRRVMGLLARGGRRAAALAQYETCCRTLAGELGVEPGPETIELYEQIRDGELAHVGPITRHPLPAGRKNNIPSWPTPLVGREAELSEIARCIRDPDCRLLTLVGPPGVGKTRLSGQVAAQLLADAEPAFADGIFFVALAPIRDPALVGPTIAQVFGLRQVQDQPLLDSLCTFLRDKQVLLVLDNFEQVVEAAPLINELLTAAPKLKVLATSRAFLRVYGERCHPVPPLALPDSQALPPPDSTIQAAAVQLFAQRAREVKADFILTAENAPAVAEICVRLDGLPLAIELAAARVRVLPPQKMLAQLDRCLQFLTGGPRDFPARYRTLRGTIDWSHNLLADGEKILFRRLGVFVGGCSLEAAEAVCSVSGDLDLLGGLEGLVDQSLVQQFEAGGEPRFSMLETLREYALEHLASSGEAETIQAQHARFFLALAEEAEPELYGVETGFWLDRLELEHDNLRAALAWSLDANLELGLRLAGTLGRFWHCRGHHAEGQDWLTKALAKSELHSGDLGYLRAKALDQAGFLASFQRDMTTALSFHEESLEIWQQIGDRPGLARALCNFGAAAGRQGELSRSRSLLEESVTLFRQTDDPTGLALALFWQGHVHYIGRDHERARASAEESITLARRIGDVNTLAAATSTLGRIAFNAAEFGAAQILLEESMALFQQTADEPGQAIMLDCLGDVSYAQGDFERATAFYQDSFEIWRVIGGRSATAHLLSRLGFVLLHQEQLQPAQELFTESLTWFQGREYREGTAVSLVGLAGVAQGQGLLERAARLLGVAVALLGTEEPKLYVLYQPEYDRIVTAVRAQIDEASFEAAQAAGREMVADDWQQATNWALGNETA